MLDGLAARIDIRDVDSAGALVERSIHLHLLAFEFPGLLLIVKLISRVSGLQDVLAAGFHYGSGERLRLRGRGGSRAAVLARTGSRGALRARVGRSRTLCVGAGGSRARRGRAGLLLRGGGRRTCRVRLILLREGHRRQSGRQRESCQYSQFLLHFYYSSGFS